MARQIRDDPTDWQVMVGAAKQGLELAGYRLDRIPGRGLSNVWNLERKGQRKTAAIRTSRNRWFAFPPLAGGTKWKTLDDVDLVVVAAVDSPEAPKDVEIYVFDADEVRRRFDAAFAAEKGAGQIVRDDFGMWIGLDTDARGIPSSVGSGLAQTAKPVAVVSLSAAPKEVEKTRSNSAVAGLRSSTVPKVPDLTTIADVMAWARKRVSEIAGVTVDAVRLDLKIEY